MPLGTSERAAVVAAVGDAGVWPATYPSRLDLLWSRLGLLRPGEVVAILYFLYIAVFALIRGGFTLHSALALFTASAIGTLAISEARHTHPWSRVLRDWLTLGLILVAYWQVDWFATPSHLRWQQTWIEWDRTLLSSWHLRAGIEAAGFLIPSTLELVYLLLYAIPPLALVALHIWGDRRGIHRFEFTLLLGTFAVYALLPHFPTTSPRLAYPGLDLPNFNGLWRGFNVWLLDHYDIATSVFPSGHVAVAFSTAFGLQRALRNRPAVWIPFFGIAVTVLTATIYCRYHYAVDGLTSLLLTAALWRMSEVFDRDV